MNWEMIVAFVLIGSLVIPISIFRGRSKVLCPQCGLRMRRTGLTHFIPDGEFPTWVCTKCGTRSYGDGKSTAK